MSAGAIEQGCSKQACAFLFGEMGLNYLHSLYMTVLQRELNPVLLCRSKTEKIYNWDIIAFVGVALT